VVLKCFKVVKGKFSNLCVFLQTKHVNICLVSVDLNKMHGEP
jgi:hypothetical protein